MGWLISVVLVYGIIMLGGGVMGYMMSNPRSTSSLIAGLVSGALLIGAAAWAKSNPKLGFGLATLTTIALIGVFIQRSMSAPSGRNYGLVGLSVIVLICLIVGHFMDNRSATPVNTAERTDTTLPPNV